MASLIVPLIVLTIVGVVLLIPAVLYLERTHDHVPRMQSYRLAPQLFKKTPHGYTAPLSMPFSELYDNVVDFKSVGLLVAVLSSPLGKKRREAIRATWWSACRQDEGDRLSVACFFFTDMAGVGVSPEIARDLEMEHRDNNDLVFSPITGAKLGLRFLYIMQWARANYDFKYLLRIDDDVMLCLPQFVVDLASMPLRYLHWGYLHCNSDGLVYIDEGITMFTSDVVRKFLSQDPEFLLCHEYGDQTIALWVQTLGFDRNKLYHPELRFHFHPPASQIPNFCGGNALPICHRYIAVHGLYNNDMIECWNNRGPGLNRSAYKRTFVSDVCPYVSRMDWTKHVGKYRKEPRLCLDKSWDTIALPYKGRE